MVKRALTNSSVDVRLCGSGRAHGGPRARALLTLPSTCGSAGPVAPMEDRALVRSGIVRRLRPLPCKKLPALQRLPPRRKRQTPRGVGELSSFLKVERQRRDAREEHRAASLFSRLLEGLDVSRPFGDGKSLGR